jgi:long-chain acyl-CoA synthetase
MIDIQAPELLKSLPESIGEVIKRWAERSPDRLALVENNGSWTYRQLDAVVTATVAWLRDSGVRPGDRVMLVCENCRAFIAIFLALTEMDGWPVLANARLSAREIDDIRDHCGARRVIYMTSVSPHATQHAKRHGAVIGDVAGLGAIGVGALNEQVEPEPIEKNSSSAERVAALIYTSGTTGLPKGVVLTHRNLLFIAAVSARIRSLTPVDRL